MESKDFFCRGSGAQLRYDPLGRLYETSGGAAGTTRFLYDGDALVAEYNTSGAMLRRYVHAVGTDTPLMWYEGSGATNRRWMWQDHQGSIFAVTDGPNVIHTNSYDPYGIPASTNAGRFQYTGQAWIPELGMYHYKARIYSPYLGRFLQTDPIGYEDQMNLYAYVGNDPINNTDPTGKCFEMSCPGSYTSLEDDQRIREADRVASGIIGNTIFEATGINAIIAAVNNPSRQNISMAMVGASPAGRIMGPMYRAARAAQQVARRLGLSGAARATRNRQGIRFGGRPGRPEQVRVMRGNPDSPNPSQRNPYATVRDSQGRSYNSEGRVIQPTEQFPNPATNPDAHIPVNRFDPDKFRFDPR